MKNIGSVRSQLFMAREIITQLDAAQEHRLLDDGELEMRKRLKMISLGLASLARTIARQRSRIRHLEEGDANTRFFHLQADGVWFSADGAKSEVIYSYFNEILGTPF